ncbi:YjbF family lipoprotein [Limibaculum sp. M0105]|uniref:YjbF family lipoprotein n=1 Tax=Thermohalobaculum xanthum TaxID=2753746 RepID=A0A8J7M8N7_9RHOB|nr:YjbF family lipoprotein [Thermohalobaculum xanthum]MBK0399738.1 YjbF family lipoprotein [Thermohalobaculum xanthum]
MALVLAALAGCSNGGAGTFTRIGESLVATLATADPDAPAPTVTRARLNEIPYATISVATDATAPAYLVPLADNGGYLDYRDQAGNSVRMFGGALAGFQAVGFDLEGVRHDERDPIAHATPLALWPTEVWREYQFSQRDLGPYSIVLKCVMQPQGFETIEIVEVTYQLVRVVETCRNVRREVTNTYWMVAGTGFIWKSRQWAGPKLGHLTIEIIRPYSSS